VSPNTSERVAKFFGLLMLALLAAITGNFFYGWW